MTYAGIYELWVHEDRLIAGTFSRRMGDGDILRLDGDKWTDLQAPETLIVLSFVTYQGKLVAALSNVDSRHANPIFTLQSDGSWQPLGVAPPEWKPAHIFNHLIAYNDILYLGVGGKRGTLSVWNFDGRRWQMLGGDGRNGSWTSPLIRQGNEWVYRLAIFQKKLYAGFASDRTPFAAPVWELTN
jgi:hypothetical protein